MCDAFENLIETEIFISDLLVSSIIIYYVFLFISLLIYFNKVHVLGFQFLWTLMFGIILTVNHSVMPDFHICNSDDGECIDDGPYIFTFVFITYIYGISNLSLLLC